MFALLLSGVPACVSARDVQEKDEIRKTLKFPEAKESRKLLLDNASGSVDVVGYDGDAVELIVYRTIRAESSEKVNEAKEDVTLDIKEERDRVKIFVNAPWRAENGSVHYHGYRFYGYEVRLDFELKVPRKTHLILKTVNEGDIRVKDVEGNYEIRNVNGEVEMLEAAGSGKVSTVNGSVRVTFRKNPEERCTFSTVNGKIEIELQKNFSADLLFKTMNGQVYTDFEFSGLPPKMATQET